MRCITCGGSMMFDRLDSEWRCLLSGRARARRRVRMPEPQRPGFRRKWSVDPQELLADCGA
jgi:hypothetical protein